MKQQFVELTEKRTTLQCTGPQIVEKLETGNSRPEFSAIFLKFNNSRVFQKISLEIAEPSVSVSKAS